MREHLVSSPCLPCARRLGKRPKGVLVPAQIFCLGYVLPG